MGEVFRARDTRLGRTVAIKILPEPLARDQEFRERFDREARAVAQLDHPHICPLYDVGNEGGTAFLVMQYLEGETLADRLSGGALPLGEALSCAIAIADALDKAHRRGIVHRDVKPGNIFLTRTGPKLLDFGLANDRGDVFRNAAATMATRTSPHLTGQGKILGTLQYMALEQLEGKDADGRADIFGLGAVLYEAEILTTGKRCWRCQVLNHESGESGISRLLLFNPFSLSCVSTKVTRTSTVRCDAERLQTIIQTWQVAVLERTERIEQTVAAANDKRPAQRKPP